LGSEEGLVDTGLGGENGGGERKPERREYGWLGRKVDTKVDVDAWLEAGDFDEVDNEETVGVGFVDAGTEEEEEEGRCPYRIFSHRLFEADSSVWRIC
jgi:hypothetical protein